MKKIAFLILTVASIQFASAATTKIHDNYVCFKNAVVDGFTITGKSATEGQPFELVTFENQTDRGCLDVRAGRKASTENVNYVKQQMDSTQTPWKSDYMVVTSKGGLSEDIPKELNFAVRGSLFITINNNSYRCDNFLVGQGSYAGGNNWWIFNNHGSIPDQWSVKCHDFAANKDVFLYPATDYENDLFKFSFTAPTSNPSLSGGNGGT